MIVLMRGTRVVFGRASLLLHFKEERTITEEWPPRCLSRGSVMQAAHGAAGCYMYVFLSIGRRPPGLRVQPEGPPKRRLTLRNRPGPDLDDHDGRPFAYAARLHLPLVMRDRIKRVRPQ